MTMMELDALPKPLKTSGDKRRAAALLSVAVAGAFKEHGRDNPADQQLFSNSATGKPAMIIVARLPRASDVVLVAVGRPSGGLRDAGCFTARLVGDEVCLTGYPAQLGENGLERDFSGLLPA